MSRVRLANIQMRDYTYLDSRVILTFNVDQLEFYAN